ncbi:hypothetical protein [Streptococcus uberis]|uniref:hypothetical protein n=1 Tax=Streptococcus uberis TaxID=1349 RepID=UPI003D77B8A6
MEKTTNDIFLTVMIDEILEHQPIDNNALIAMELYQTGMANTGSEWLSILRVYNAGMIAGKRIERSKKCKNSI